MALPEDPINTYRMGQRVKLFVDFLDASDPPIPADPDTVILKYIEGDGTPITAGGVTNPSVGRYEFQLQIPQDGAKSGSWIYRFEGTSAADIDPNAADERRFTVDPSPFYVAP